MVSPSPPPSPGAANAHADIPAAWSIVPAHTTAVLATACWPGIDWRNCNKRKILRDMFAAGEDLAQPLRGMPHDAVRFTRCMNRMTEQLQAQRRANATLLQKLCGKTDFGVRMQRMLRDVRI
jgi:hypothetical protein